jgi:hypothetical protein
MANKKITELTALTTAASDDVLAIVDVSGTAETKKITVANLTGGSLLTATTVVNNAAVLTMKYDDTPITLVAAPGAGKIIVPINFTIVGVGAGGAEGSSYDLRFGWSAIVSTTTDYTNSIRDYMNGISSGTHTSILSPLNTSFATSLPFTAANRPFQAWCTGDFDGGWSMTIYTSYYEVTE